MTPALGLLAYAGLILVGVAPLLARARWPERAPRLGIAAWLAMAGSSVAAVVLGSLALLVPTARISADLAPLLAACVMAVQARYAHPGGAALAAAGIVVAVAVTGRAAWCVARTLTVAWLARRRQRSGLAMAGRPDTRLGAVVVDHPEPAAWCLPGHGRPVVLTSGAVRLLDGAQLAAIMAHERAHQRGHHHLLVCVAGSLAAAFPRVRAFGVAHEQVARLAEMVADDAAVSAVPRLTVAGALLAVASAAPAVAGALGAGGSATGARVRRLIAAPAPLGRAAMTAGTVSVTALMLVPFALLAGPALALWGQAGCPVLAAAMHMCG